MMEITENILKFEKPHSTAGNMVLRLDDQHFISFNPDVSHVPFRFIGALIGEDNPGEMETAIVQTDAKPKCRVLRGDHREAFTAAASSGWSAVEVLYETLAPEHRSEWSED